MNFKISFNDGVEVTITNVQDLNSNCSIDIGDFFVNVFGGSVDDIDLNNALFRGDEVVVFNTINNRLGGVLTA